MTLRKSFGERGYRGDTILLDAICRRRDSSIIDLTGASLWFTAKNAIEDADVDAVFQKTDSDGIVVTDAAGGAVDITIDPEDTEDLGDEEVVLQCDLQVKELDGTISTVARGSLRISPDVTRSTT